MRRFLLKCTDSWHPFKNETIFGLEFDNGRVNLAINKESYYFNCCGPFEDINDLQAAIKEHHDHDEHSHLTLDIEWMDAKADEVVVDGISLKPQNANGVPIWITPTYLDDEQRKRLKEEISKGIASGAYVQQLILRDKPPVLPHNGKLDDRGQCSVSLGKSLDGLPFVCLEEQPHSEVLGLDIKQFLELMKWGEANRDELEGLVGKS